MSLDVTKGSRFMLREAGVVELRLKGFSSDHGRGAPFGAVVGKIDRDRSVLFKPP